MSVKKKTKKISHKKVKKEKIAKLPSVKKTEDFHSINWQTHEFKKFDPPIIWFVYLIVVLVALSFYLIYLGLYSLLVGLILVAFLIVVETVLEPRLVRVEINDEGVNFGEKKIKYTTIMHFGIFADKKKNQHLVLHTTSKFLSVIDIPLGKQSPEEIRLILAKHIPYVHLNKHPRDKFVFWR